MKRQLIVLLLALPLALIAGAWSEVSRGHGDSAATFTTQAWATVVGFYHSLASLPESGTLLVLGACCFMLAWLLYRRWMKAQSE